jgi:hypothetical protein
MDRRTLARSNDLERRRDRPPQHPAIIGFARFHARARRSVRHPLPSVVHGHRQSLILPPQDQSRLKTRKCRRRKNFPQQRLLGALKKLHYKGPVCLLCFAVKSDKKSNLKQSIDAWEKIFKELA